MFFFCVVNNLLHCNESFKFNTYIFLVVWLECYAKTGEIYKLVLLRACPWICHKIIQRCAPFWSLPLQRIYCRFQWNVVSVVFMTDDILIMTCIVCSFGFVIFLFPHNPQFICIYACLKGWFSRSLTSDLYPAAVFWVILHPHWSRHVRDASSIYWPVCTSGRW